MDWGDDESFKKVLERVERQHMLGAFETVRRVLRSEG